MGFTAITGNQAPRQLAFATAFAEAWNERLRAFAEAEETAPVARDLHRKCGPSGPGPGFLYRAMAWCEAHCGDFADPARTVDGCAALGYTLANFRADAGMASGFPRVPYGTAWPEDWTDYGDPAYSYGLPQHKDLFGPWCYHWLQQAFKTLKWPLIRAYGVGAADQKKSNGPTSPWFDTWPESTANTDAEYTHLNWSDDLPMALYQGWHVSDYWSFVFASAAVCRKCKMKFHTHSDLSGDVLWFARPDKLEQSSTSVFDGNGDFPGHDYGEWHLWLTDAAAAGPGDVQSSAVFGNLTLPTPCAEPSIFGATRGYVVNYAWAVWKPAFEYV